MKAGEDLTEADGSGEKKVRFTLRNSYLYGKEIASVQLIANIPNAHFGTNMKLSKHFEKARIIMLRGLDKLLHLADNLVDPQKTHSASLLKKASHSLPLARNRPRSFFLVAKCRKYKQKNRDWF